ncbi:hypothetical protein CGK29_22730 [Vibrio parahaemolyticus]|nr:hypothetical protein CGK29_22730 [Vibrio parahaemolyticus]HCG8770176.1 DUF3265 domain-containing protein [Vibrio parahaemolyticus]
MIRHAWHFYYALVLVIKVVCGSIVLCASHLNWALVANEENAAKAEYLGLMSMCFWLGFRISIFSYLGL